MRVALFYHSLLSDWNHGNAHFLRGIARELLARGHQVAIYEPRDGWSLRNLIAEHGSRPVRDFFRAFPTLRSTPYDEESLDLGRALEGADLVIVHEWNSPRLVHRIGRFRRRSGAFRLLFHDTHHRSVTAPQEMAQYDLSGYDGVLAFGGVVRDLYLERGWARRAWTWHEAADVRLFRPLPHTAREGDVVWIGNWGDDERTQELAEFLFEPVRALGLRARVHGVRYPPEALHTLQESGIDYAGWLPNYRVPQVLARFALTVHIPRRPYVRRLPGIPTIRVFEALACGVPLISAPWRDAEGLFRPGTDYLVAHDGREMQAHMRRLLAEPAEAEALGRAGRETILARHTCAHRVDELLGICEELGIDTAAAPIASGAAALEVAADG